MTAIVFKNESSAMASTFSFTSSIDVNRSANITLDNIIALSSQAVKTSDDSADLSFAASQTAAAQRTLDGSSSLTATSTLSSEIENVQVASASLSTTSTLTTTRYFGTGRPRDITIGSWTFDNSIKKYGTHSIVTSSTNGVASRVSDPGIVPGYNDDFAIELYYYLTEIGRAHV